MLVTIAQGRFNHSVGFGDLISQTGRGSGELSVNFAGVFLIGSNQEKVDTRRRRFAVFVFLSLYCNLVNIFQHTDIEVLNSNLEIERETYPHARTNVGNFLTKSLRVSYSFSLSLYFYNTFVIQLVCNFLFIDTRLEETLYQNSIAIDH